MFFYTKMNEYLFENNYEIIKLIVLLLIGCLLGIVYTNFINEEMQYSLIQYFDGYNKSVAEDEYIVNNVNTGISIIKNISLIFIIIILLGSTIIFTPLLNCILMFKGFTLGITITVIIMTIGSVKGIIYTFISLLIPNTILIIFLIYIITLWKGMKKLLRNSSITEYKKNVYIMALKTIIALITLIVLLLPIQMLLNQFLFSYIKII